MEDQHLKKVNLSIFEDGKTLMLDEGFLSSGGGNTVKWNEVFKGQLFS